MINKGNYGLKAFSHIVLALICVCCLIPFVAIISISLTPEDTILKDGFNLLPKALSFDAYKMLLKNPTQLVRSYSVTIFISVVGTLLSLIVSTQFAYAISRRNFRLKRALSIFILITMLFSGGLVPSYILISKYLKLRNSLWAIILPGLVSAWNVMVLKSYLTAIPEAIIEAAKIDGAGEFYIFYRIVVPMVSSGVATIGIFVLLAFWNEWYGCMLYIDDPDLYSLQYLLQNMLSKMKVLQLGDAALLLGKSMPKNSLRMATCVVAIGPIIFAFLIFKKYFVNGITVGSVKG